MIKIIPVDTPLYPDPRQPRLICGVVVVEWNYAVVYIRNPNCAQKTTQKFYFTFYGSGDYQLEEIVMYVDQWTYYRGHQDLNYPVDSHGFNRAKQLACTCVGTFRRNYLKKYGNAPNPLLLSGTLDEGVSPCTKRPSLQKIDASRWAQSSFDFKNAQD